MILFFRCDGNNDIGSGHIMRCLSIADNAVSQGNECCFLTSDHSFQEIIQEHKHKNIILNIDYKNLNSDLKYIKDLIKKHMPAAIFIDSYYVDKSYLCSLHSICLRAGVKLIYIDDILAFPYSCDILINYNIYGSDMEYEYKELYENVDDMEPPQFLLGTSYVPLRAEFQGLTERVVKRAASNILISTGGADSAHLGLALIQAVINDDEILDRFHFDFIIGPMNTDAEKITLLASKVSNITIHQNVTSMSDLMHKCDVAISAAGSTIYELCATQTPAITYILADNQILGAQAFEQHGILKNIGDVRMKGCENLAKDLIYSAIKLCQDYEERKKIAAMQRMIVDGMGAKRIIDFLSG